MVRGYSVQTVTLVHIQLAERCWCARAGGKRAWTGDLPLGIRPAVPTLPEQHTAGAAGQRRPASTRTLWDGRPDASGAPLEWGQG